MSKLKLQALILLSVFCFSPAANAQSRGGPANQWISLSPTGGPPPARQAHSTVFDLQTDDMIVFGGTDGECGGECDFNDVWSLSFGANPQWTQISPSGTLPPARTGASAAFDSGNSALIIFGGGEGSSSPCQSDTWVLSNTNGIYDVPAWSQLDPGGTLPAARISHSAVYDPGSNRMIVFGGSDCSSEGAQFYNDVWVLTNANGLSGPPNWVQLTFSGPVPSARGNHTAVYDPASNTMIIFGGTDATDQFNDVWVLSNANGVSGTPTWTQLSPSGTPPSPRLGSTATYDPATNRMTLFAGNDSDTAFNDVWVLSSANGTAGTPMWTQLQPSGTLPDTRSQLGAAFNPFTNQMVIFGGSGSDGSLADAWVLTNASGPLVLTTNTLPNGSVGLPYSANPTARSGNTPYTWSVSSGSLPPGLSLDSVSGAITGTPTSAGPFSFGLQAIDSSSPQQTSTQSFALTVTASIAPNFHQYTIPTSDSFPAVIASGPDGALWFTENEGNNIGRISVSGAITEYPIPTSASQPQGIAAGPDGALWFSESQGNNIGRITTAGVISEYSVDLVDPPMGINSGPDGALWFTEWGTFFFGRISTAGMVTQFELPSTQESVYNTDNTVSGPDGALWFTDFGNGEIGQITPSGVVTEFPIPTPNSGPSGITAGPDGALWFTETDSGANKIGRITTAGVITEYSIPTPSSFPSVIAAGADGALWFTETNAGQIGRITTSGVITEFAIPAENGPNSITLGPDGALWFTGLTNTIGRLSFVPALGLTCSFPGIAHVGTPYSASCTPAGGTSPYTYLVTAGTLPPGLNVATSTGATTGTPANIGTFSFTVQVTDSSSPAQVATYIVSNVVVEPPILALTCTAPAGAQVGTAYSGTCTSSGGTPSYVWSISAGTLPPGLSLAAGTIAGTPVRSGTYAFTVNVTDSGSPAQMAAQPLTITAAPAPLGIATTVAPSGTSGIPYSTTVAAQGGTAPYIWSITAGLLPAGLTLNAATGAITGMPTTSGSFPFVLKVVDSGTPTAQSVSQPLSIYINAAAAPTPTFSLCAPSKDPSTCVSLPAAQSPEQPIGLSAQLNEPASTAIQGTLTLTFAANAVDVPAGYMDPALQFVDSNGKQLGITYSFTVPVAATSVALAGHSTRNSSWSHHNHTDSRWSASRRFNNYRPTVSARDRIRQRSNPERHVNRIRCGADCKLHPARYEDSHPHVHGCCGNPDHRYNIVHGRYELRACAMVFQHGRPILRKSVLTHRSIYVQRECECHSIGHCYSCELGWSIHSRRRFPIESPANSIPNRAKQMGELRDVNSASKRLRFSCRLQHADNF